MKIKIKNNERPIPLIFTSCFPCEQNNSKPRILLAGSGEHFTHLRISNPKLCPCYYLSHGSSTPASPLPLSLLDSYCITRLILCTYI